MPSSVNPATAELALQARHVVMQIAPAACAALSELFGAEPALSRRRGKPVNRTRVIAAATRMAGISDVSFTTLGADIIAYEDSRELLRRFATSPTVASPPRPLLLSSCCPAWTGLVRREFPILASLLSTSRSPMLSLAPIVARRLAVPGGAPVVQVAVMPCLAKKVESARDFAGGIGAVVSTVEYAAFLRSRGVTNRVWAALCESVDDGSSSSPLPPVLGESSGVAQIFGTSGGVAEAVLRTAYELHTGNPLAGDALQRAASRLRKLAPVCTASIDLGDGRELRVAAVHGTDNVRNLLRSIARGELPPRNMPHFIGGMACFGGCVGGTGQPASQPQKQLTALRCIGCRTRALYDAERCCTIRTPASSPVIKDIFEQLGGPDSALARSVLHIRR